MTSDIDIEAVAQEIAEDMISAARSAPLSDPVTFVTGNSYMPPLRSYGVAEAVWQASEDGEDFFALHERIESLLQAANVDLGCPDYDNALYVVDLARFEYVADSVGDSLQDDWRPIS